LLLVRDQYDHGGVSGGMLERSGLERHMANIEDQLVYVIVVYKIDRLSCSLADFAKLLEVYNRNSVTIVSVTQSFNTTTSIGRLTLNIVLIFARFLDLGSCTILAQEGESRGLRTSRGNQIDKKYLNRMLSNRASIGKGVPKGDSYLCEHEAIIDRALWDKVHLILTESTPARGTRTRAQTLALLKGLVFGTQCRSLHARPNTEGRYSLPLLF
jgi:site-specific DNA recombinase